MRLAAHHHELVAPILVWEECACLLCGSADSTPLYEAADPLGARLRFLLVKCNRCGLSFTNPRPDPVSIAQFYPTDYPCHHGKQRLREADPLGTLPSDGPARLLDFGCGGGDFLRRMHALGWSVTGLDRAVEAVARVQSFGLSASVGTLPYPLWSDECFEAITMWQSIEHTHQPLEVLRGAYRLLTTGGRLFVAVPNFDGFGARWFGPNWYGLDVPRHLTHFTANTLHIMLSQAGFKSIEMSQQQRNSWIRHSAEHHGGGILTTRLGSSIAGAWGRLRGQAENILASASK